MGTVSKEATPPITKEMEEEIFMEYKKALHAVPGLNVDKDDNYLYRFLRSKSFDIPTAVKLYKSTDGWMEKNAEVLKIPFRDCIPAYQGKLLTVLKQKSENGCTMIIAKADKWEAEKMILEVIIRALFHLIEESQTTVENQINGIIIILDVTGLSMAKTIEGISHFTLKNIKLLVGFAQGGSPVKVKEIHSLSSPLVLATTYTGFKYLLKRKMRNRIKVYYEGATAIHKIIGKDRLPHSLGGNIPDDLAEDTELMNSLYRRHNLIYSL